MPFLIDELILLLLILLVAGIFLYRRAKKSPMVNKFIDDLSSPAGVDTTKTDNIIDAKEKAEEQLKKKQKENEKTVKAIKEENKKITEAL
jgi:hypothetical protein